MRYAAMLLATAALSACGADGAGPSAVTHVTPSTPVAPLPPTGVYGARAWMWGMVFPAGSGGPCLEGATVRLVSSQGEGQSIVQEPCDAWSDGGFQFLDLAPDVAITIRASARGYVTRDTTFVPSTYSPQRAMQIVLAKE